MLIIRLVVELGFKHFVQHFDSMALDDSSTSCNLFLLSWCKVSGGFYGVKTYFSVLVVQTKLNNIKNNDLNIAIVSYEYEYEDDDKNDGTPFLYSLLSLTSSFFLMELKIRIQNEQIFLMFLCFLDGLLHITKLIYGQIEKLGMVCQNCSKNPLWLSKYLPEDS